MSKKNTITVKQIKSTIGREVWQQKNLCAIGLKKIGCTVTIDATPEHLGIINKVSHLIEISEVV